MMVGFRQCRFELENIITVKIVTAIILDSTHLKLSQPIHAKPGESIKISIPDEDEDERLWREAAKEHFLKAYDDEDGIYDKL